MVRIEKGHKVGIVKSVAHAIDQTPIYKIVITHALESGDVLCWDKADGYVRYCHDAKTTQNHD
jgi:hypothetical protein